MNRKEQIEEQIITLQTELEFINRGWKHGDVFISSLGVNTIYLVVNHVPRAHCLEGYCSYDHEGKDLDDLLSRGKFLFNVNDKIGEKT